MDPLGNVVREFVRQQREDNVRTATSLAKDFRKGGMSKAQAEEMLCSAGIDSDVIEEALRKAFGPRR